MVIGLAAQVNFMKVFYDVRLLAVIDKEFEDNQGDVVEYKEVHFLNVDDDSREVIKLTTRKDFPLSGKDEGSNGVAEIDIDVAAKRKPRLLSFKPHNGSKN